MYLLENQHVEARIKTEGAELISLINKATGVEHLWQGDPKFWKRQSPVLFPIVGRLKDDELRLDSYRFQLNKHGFARDSEFTLVDDDDNFLSFELTDDEETRKQYPFSFRFLIHYQLKPNGLHINYEVFNTDEKTIYFSLGGHPAFNVPFSSDESYDDYYLEFEKNETLDRHLLDMASGLRTGELATNYLDDEKRIALNKELFKDDALIFENPKSRQLTLTSDKNSSGVRFSWDNFKSLGIWAAYQAPFVCLEPWNGVADDMKGHHDFTTKKGIIDLAVGERFSSDILIELI